MTELTTLRTRLVQANGIDINVAEVGSGPPLLLVHGWPHTWQVWQKVMLRLADKHRVMALDLRGIGGSTRAATGYDAATLAADLAAMLDALDAAPAAVAAIDAGVVAAWMLAMTSPAKVSRLVLMEGLVGSLPGAEKFLSTGPPWWFGFHAVPGLAETVLEGQEGAYLDFFYRTGTRAGAIDGDLRDAFVDAYRGPETMRCGFELYRAMPENGRQVRAIADSRRLTIPTLAIAGGVVGDALAGQLRAGTDDLTAVAIPDVAHIIPQDAPIVLAETIGSFIAP